MTDKETYTMMITCFNYWEDIIITIPFGMTTESYISFGKCHICGCKLDNRGINKKRI